jgi:hypothetical protein
MRVRRTDTGTPRVHEPHVPAIRARHTRARRQRRAYARSQIPGRRKRRPLHARHIVPTYA